MSKLNIICGHCPKNYYCKEPCAFLLKVKADAKGVCKDCIHYGECQSPCFLAKAFIGENTKVIVEKPRDFRKTPLLIIYSYEDTKATRESDIQTTVNGSENEIYSPINDTSNDTMKDFWNGAAYEVKTKQLGIFLDRFFNNLSNDDIAVKYNVNKEHVSIYYMNAKKQAYELIEALRTETKIQANRKIAEIHKKKLNKLQANVKAFLLYHCFDLPYKEIAEILEVKPGTVGKYISKLTEDVDKGIPAIKFDKDFNFDNIPRGERGDLRKALSH